MLRIIENQSPLSQVVYHDGVRHEFSGNEQREMPAELAQKLAATNPLLRVTAAPTQYMVEESQEEGCVVNTSGNPWAPNTVKGRKLDAETFRESIADVPNLNKEPRTFSASYSRGSQEITDQNGGLMERFLGYTTVTIPPYSYKILPRAIAHMLVARSSRGEAGSRGLVKLGRKLPSQWPDNLWSYEDVYDFLELHGGDEAVKGIPGPKTQASKSPENFEEMRRRLFFIGTDLTKRLFTMDEFSAYKEQKHGKPEEKKAV